MDMGTQYNSMRGQGAADAAVDTALPSPPVVTVLMSDQLANSPVFLDEWDALCAAASEANVFSERWYLQAALEALDPECDIALVCIRHGGQLIGVLPLERARGYARLPVDYLTNWLNHNAFLGTPLVRRGAEILFWKAVLAHLDAVPRGPLFFHLNALPVDGPVAIALHIVCSEQHRRIGLVHNEERALLERGLSPTEYLEAHVRGKKRKELRRQHNRLAELGALQFDRSNGATGLDCWIDEFFALERAGWKGPNGSALDCADDTRALFRGVLHGAANAGKLELLSLRLDGRAIAMLVTFLSAPGAFSFKTTFDEDYARFSPGVLLQIENLALLERAGIDYCDSCAAQDHPMIDSLWGGRRKIGRWSIAIGGPLRRGAFAVLLSIEQAKARLR
jgi:CelD/BcsL family acetyltransferase involved in cellulose biosynthesis